MLRNLLGFMIIFTGVVFGNAFAESNEPVRTRYSFLFITEKFFNAIKNKDVTLIERENANPLFYGKNYGFSVFGGVSNGNGSSFSSVTSGKIMPEIQMVGISYVKPNMVFEINGNVRFDLLQYYATKDILKEFNNFIFGMMQEGVLFHYGKFYTKVGLGFYYGSSADLIGSRFFFGQRYSMGVAMENYNVEIFGRHFSNGNLQNPVKSMPDGYSDVGYNVYGLEFVYKLKNDDIARWFIN